MKNKLITILLFLLLTCVFSGCFDSGSRITCSNSFCEAEFPEKYGVRDFYHRTVCPNCAEAQIEKHVIKQEEVHSDIRNYGAHIDRDYDYMIVECTSCSYCGYYAPADLYDQNGERICIDCITEALQDDKVARAVWNYYEYG